MLFWVFSGPYFPVFSPNTGKYGPEKTPYLDTFRVVEKMVKDWKVKMCKMLEKRKNNGNFSRISEQ